jgi:hypothetical protein
VKHEAPNRTVVPSGARQADFGMFLHEKPSFGRLRGLRRNDLGKIIYTIKSGVGQSVSGMRSFNILWSVPLFGNCGIAKYWNSGKLQDASSS